MRSRILSAVLLFAFVTSLVPVSNVVAEPMLALTSSGSLTVFDSDNPGAAQRSVTISGLQTSETVVAFDFRPANGILYAVGSTSRLYSINIDTGVATSVSSAPFSTPLAGGVFSADFNPVVDRLRIVSDTGQNLRINPEDGTLVTADTTLAYATGDPNVAAAPNVTAIGYTNNFPGAATTTLFVLDSTADVLALQGGAAGAPSPNAGELTTLGSAGVDATTNTGFDFSSLSGTPYVAMSRAGQTSSELYRVALVTGFPLTRIGALPANTLVRDIATPVFEATVPSVLITAPARVNSTTRRNSVVFSGSASDNTYVQNVQYRYRLNSGRYTAFTRAAGTGTWTFSLPTRRVGRSTVQVKAVDAFGNESAVTSYRVTRR